MLRTWIALLLAGFASCAGAAGLFTSDDWSSPDMTVAPPVAPPAGDDGPLTLSVEQAVALALTNNPSLIAQQQEPIIAGTFAAVERAVFDPTVIAGVERDADETQAEVGISKLLPTGTTLELTVGRSDGESSSRNTDTQTELTVTQALLDGFGIATNLVALRQARTDVVASAYQLRGFVTNLVAEVESTYWRYLGARARIDILENALEVAERQAQAAEARIAAGAVAAIQRYAFEAEAAQRRQDLIDGRAEARLLRTRLLRLIAPSGTTPWQRRLKPTSSVQIEQSAPIDTTRAYITLAWQRRADLNQARLAAARNELEIVATRNGLLPRLDVFLRFGNSSFGRDDERGDFGAEDDYDLTAGLQFEYVLGNREAEARSTRAQATRLQTRAAIENLKRLIAADVQTAAIELERTAAQIEASAATLRLREQTLEAEQARFRVGRSTALLVAQAQRDLLAAQLDRLDTFISYRQALINLHVANGSLLTRRLIDAPGTLPPNLPWS